jgi:hypothetical protein
MGNNGTAGVQGMPGTEGMLRYSAEGNQFLNFFINADSTPQTDLAISGLKNTSQLQMLETYDDWDKRQWRIVEGTFPYPTQLDALYRASRNNSLANPGLLAYPGCWFNEIDLVPERYTLIPQGNTVHLIGHAPSRSDSGYWALFNEESAGSGEGLIRLDLLCYVQYFEPLNPGGALVDAFIPLDNHRAFVVWRIPGTFQTRLARLDYSSAPEVSFLPVESTISEVVTEIVQVGSDLALLAETSLWLVSPQNQLSELDLPDALAPLTLQQIWGGRQSSFYLTGVSNTDPRQQQRLIRFQLQDGAAALSYHTELNLEADVAKGVASDQSIYLLTKDNGIEVLEPNSGEVSSSRNIDIAAITEAEVGRGVGTASEADLLWHNDRLHVLMLREQALWWMQFDAGSQLVRRDVAELDVEYTINNVQLFREGDQVKAFYSGEADSGRPQWATLLQAGDATTVTDSTITTHGNNSSGRSAGNIYSVTGLTLIALTSLLR